ncbi:hypothetical protein Tco_0718148 [Tanacetum coccineum]
MIVGIKRLLSAVEVNAAGYVSTAAAQDIRKSSKSLLDLPESLSFVEFHLHDLDPCVSFFYSFCLIKFPNIKYLRNTKNMVLVYGAKPEDELKVSCYADAIDWKSAKQSTTAMSSTEAEYIVVAEASMEAVWTRKFIDGLTDVMPSNKRPMEMLCDNEPALAIAGDPRILKGARCFQRKYHYIREVIQQVILKKVHTYDNVFDPFTEAMPLNKHFEHAMAIGIVPASSLM